MTQNKNKADRFKSRAPSIQRRTDRQTDRLTDRQSGLQSRVHATKNHQCLNGKGQSPPTPGAGRISDIGATPLQALLLIFFKLVAMIN